MFILYFYLTVQHSVHLCCEECSINKILLTYFTYVFSSISSLHLWLFHFLSCEFVTSRQTSRTGDTSGLPWLPAHPVNPPHWAVWHRTTQKCIYYFPYRIILICSAAPLMVQDVLRRLQIVPHASALSIPVYWEERPGRSVPVGGYWYLVPSRNDKQTVQTWKTHKGHMLRFPSVCLLSNPLPASGFFMNTCGKATKQKMLNCGKSGNMLWRGQRAGLSRQLWCNGRVHRNRHM